MDGFSPESFHGSLKTRISKASITESLMPELKLVQDPELRDKTVSAWALACQTGGYSKIEDIPSAGFEWLKVSLLQHIKQVTRITVSILDTISEMGAKRNRDHAIVGALCHDIGVPLEMRKGQKGFHTPVSGAACPGTFYGYNPNMPQLEPGVSYQVARHSTLGFFVMMAVGMPEHIAHIVGGHSREGDLLMRTPEASLIHFVDLLWWNEVGSWGYPAVPEWRDGEPSHWHKDA